MEKIAKFRQTRLSRITYSVVLALGLSAICFYLAPQYQYGRGVLAIQAGLIWLLLIGWRFSYSGIFDLSKPRIPTLILGCGEPGRSALQLLNAPHSQFDVKGFLDDDPEKLNTQPYGARVLGTFAKIAEIIHDMGIRAVVLAMDPNGSSRITRKILEARLSGVEVIDMLTLYERVAMRLPVKYIEDRWLLLADGFSLISNEYVQKLKRIFDLFFSAILLLIMLPMMLLAALAVRLDSPGPVFYKQQRVGRGSKTFAVYKFRSMYSNAEQQGAMWAQKIDPRVTRVGKWMRRFHIDELPQLWNVLVGEMSMVGPRPERPEFVKELDNQIPYYCARHTVTPGITGWAQIKYRYGATVEDASCKLEYDLYYVKNMSLLLDFKILLRTVGVVILRQGAR
jgi:sugar transferase (PEP-CTERM system associated)